MLRTFTTAEIEDVVSALAGAGVFAVKDQAP